MKKGNNSSNIWALRQIADFMASTSHAVFPTSSMSTWGSWGAARSRGRGSGGGKGAVRSGLVAAGLRSERCSCINRPGGAGPQPERYLPLLLMLLRFKEPRRITPDAQKSEGRGWWRLKGEPSSGSAGGGRRMTPCHCDERQGGLCMVPPPPPLVSGLAWREELCNSRSLARPLLEAQEWTVES